MYFCYTQTHTHSHSHVIGFFTATRGSCHPGEREIEIEPARCERALTVRLTSCGARIASRAARNERTDIARARSLQRRASGRGLLPRKCFNKSTPHTHTQSQAQVREVEFREWNPRGGFLRTPFARSHAHLQSERRAERLCVLCRV